MATVNFLYRSKKEKAPLTARLLFRHIDTDKVIAAKTKLLIESDYWKIKHNQKRPKDIDIANKQIEINTELNKIENSILNSFHETDISNIDKSWLAAQIEEYYNPKTSVVELPTNLLEYYDHYLDSKKNEITLSTIKKYEVVFNLLKKFSKTTHISFEIKDVNEHFRKEFETYCLDKSYAPNTIDWALRSVKSVCNHAKYNGLEISEQLRNFKFKNVKSPNPHLSFEELDKIEELDNLTESLDNARDWLLISCYTGQRFSDFIRFRERMIRTEKGKKLIEFTQKKTNKEMTIPLHKKVLAILNKRDGKFPRSISSQKYNGYIKKVCKRANIDEIIRGSKLVKIEDDVKFPYRREVGHFEKWELISSHIGRRSFATNYYGEIPTSFLSYITGHSTERMFLKYIGKSNKDLAMELSKYF